MPETTAPLAEPAAPVRALSSPPSDAVDPATRLPMLGSYEGPLPRVDLGLLGRSLPFRIAHEKAWYYVALASPEIFVGVGILRFGYAASTFAFLFERGRPGGTPGRFLADRSHLGPPFIATYDGDGGIAFRLGQRVARFQRAPGARAFDLEVLLGDLHVHARLSGDLTPPPISAIAALGDGLVHVTEKRALLSVEGEVEIAGRRFGLDGAHSGFDRSHGYLPRRTIWRWAYALGRTAAGDSIGVNLVDGFVGEAECAVWINDRLFPVGEGRFLFDPGSPLKPWRLRSACGSVDLTFEPGDLHAEHQNLGLIKTRFVQPVGVFNGTVKAGGRTHVLERVLGVVEDQDATW